MELLTVNCEETEGMIIFLPNVCYILNHATIIIIRTFSCVFSPQSPLSRSHTNSVIIVKMSLYFWRGTQKMVHVPTLLKPIYINYLNLKIIHF